MVCIDDNLLYTLSDQHKGAIHRVSLKSQTSGHNANKTLNIGMQEPLAIYRVPIDAKAVRKPENTTFDLVIGSDAKTDALFVCTIPADP